MCGDFDWQNDDQPSHFHTFSKILEYTPFLDNPKSDPGCSRCLGLQRTALCGCQRLPLWWWYPFEMIDTDMIQIDTIFSWILSVYIYIYTPLYTCIRYVHTICTLIDVYLSVYVNSYLMSIFKNTWAYEDSDVFGAPAGHGEICQLILQQSLLGIHGTFQSLVQLLGCHWCWDDLGYLDYYDGLLCRLCHLFGYLNA